MLRLQEALDLYDLLNEGDSQDAADIQRILDGQKRILRHPEDKVLASPEMRPSNILSFPNSGATSDGHD